MAEEETVAHANGVVHVSFPIIVLSALPLLCLAFVGRDLGLRNELVVGIARSFVQLMIMGLILRSIFTIGMNSPSVVVFCKFRSARLVYLIAIVENFHPHFCASINLFVYLATRRSFYDTHVSERVHEKDKIYIPVPCIGDVPCHLFANNCRRFICISGCHTPRTSMESTVRDPYMWHDLGELHQWRFFDCQRPHHANDGGRKERDRAFLSLWC